MILNKILMCLRDCPQPGLLAPIKSGVPSNG